MNNKTLIDKTSLFLMVLMFAFLPIISFAEQQDGCTINEVVTEVVSDTSNMVVGGDNAVLTYSSHPNWTASIPGASWIWKSFLVADSQQDDFAIFTKDFSITNPVDVTSAQLTINADNSYTVVFNGLEIGGDQTEFNYYQENQRVFDIKQYLTTGTNTLSVTVKNWALQESSPQTNPAGLLYKIRLVENKNNCPALPPLHNYCSDSGDISASEFMNAVNSHLITYSLDVNSENTKANFTINNQTNCTIPTSLTSYKMFDQVLSHQEIFSKSIIQATSSTSYSVDLPTCMAQIDAWYGVGPDTLFDSTSYSYPNVPFVLAYKFIQNSGNGFADANGQFCTHTITPPPPTNIPPSITLIGANPLNLTVGTPFTDPGATAIDQEDGNLTSVIVKTGNVNASTTGTYTLTYSVTDSGGLSASTTRTVVVNPVVCTSNCGGGGGPITVPINIIASKIVCNSETDLPNWGLGGPDITVNTTSQFLNSHPNCHLESGWKFQWANSTAPDPGQSLIGEASGWNSFGPTNIQGVASTSISILSTTPYVWMREVLKDNYLSFTYPGENNTNTNSAEMYCRTDVLNYDNYDRVDGPLVSGETYYCIAFNALKTVVSVNTPPSITLIGANPLNLTVGTPFTDPGATAIDQEDGNLTSVIVKTGNVNASTTGTYTLTYSVTDSGGLSASTTRTVVVNPVVCTSNCGGEDGPKLPTVSLTASPSSITAGATSTLSWTSANTNFCSAFWTTATSTSGSKIISPTSTTDYVITCTGPEGSKTATTTIVVNPIIPPVEPPPVTPPSSDGGGGNGDNGGGGLGGHRHSVIVGEVLGVTSCSYLKDYLKIDWTNDKIEVLKLQSFLNVFEKENLSLTGVFNQDTFAAVSRFQTKYSADILTPWGPKVTKGFVYILTKKKINEIYCKTIINLNQADKDEIVAFRTFSEQNPNAVIDSGNTGFLPSGDIEPKSNNTRNVLSNNVPDASSLVVELEKSAATTSNSAVRNVAVSLFALPQKIFSSAKYFIAFLVLLVILGFILKKLFEDDTENQDAVRPVPPVISGTEKASPIIILPGIQKEKEEEKIADILPDEEIVIGDEDEIIEE